MSHKTRLKVVSYERSGNLKQKTFINKSEHEIREILHTQQNVTAITQIDTYVFEATKTFTK